MSQKEISQSTQVSFISQAERKNARFQRYMEDAHTIVPCLDGKKDVFFAGVYDGHGGKETAQFVSERLHVNLVKALNTPELKSTESCLEHAFLLTDIESKNEELRNSGCTGVVVLIMNTDGKRIVYSANAGDSRSLLYTNGKTVRLSVDHKAADPEETKRIEGNGGFVMNHRVLGILAVSRSFGDHLYKRYVPADPYINSVELTEESEFVVIACDGVFDVLEDDEVCKIVREEILSGNVDGCADKLVQESVDRGSTDNITAIV
ncbi:hypothetical protein WA538_000079, partial [Blastocystis sp. DL]